MCITVLWRFKGHIAERDRLSLPAESQTKYTVAMLRLEMMAFCEYLLEAALLQPIKLG
jgi:hypothetical protein